MIESILTDFNHDKKVFTAVEVERHFLTFSQKTKLQANVIDGSSIFGSSLRAGEETNSHLYLCSKDVCPHGWSFYNGSCYLTSEKCETWTNASLICRSMGANLPAIDSQEENVYIQHRHNGDKAWIGLNDIATEGVFAWVDGCPFKFRYWAQNQPNNFRGEDCVHTLGPGHGYMWNDVDCSACHQYTCKKGELKIVVRNVLYKSTNQITLGHIHVTFEGKAK